MAEKETKRGRKSKYESDIAPHLALVEEMAHNMTEKEIAKSFGVSYSGAWARYKNAHPELVAAIIRGRRTLVADLRSALIKRALGYKDTEVKTTTEQFKFSRQARAMLIDCGYTDEQLEEVKVVKVETKERNVPPDVTAINLALRNYDKGNWFNDPAEYELKVAELQLKKKRLEQDEWGEVIDDDDWEDDPKQFLPFKGMGKADRSDKDRED